MTILNVFLLVMTVVYVAVVWYLRYGWAKLRSSTTQIDDVVLPKVSVLIAARNEEENIARTLDCVVDQRFPKDLLEIIVIDDHSTDRTASIVREYASRGVQLLQLNEGGQHNSYKKLAITKAIARADGDVIVTTDADCRMGQDWLITAISHMQKYQLDMLSSPVSYDEEKHFFERIQTLEFLYLIGLGAAGIGNGNPTTCNGANLAYRKKAFYDVGGFKGIDELASGDDELLLHKIAEQNPKKIGFCQSREAIVYTDAKPTLSSFLNQRRRWASKSTKYKDKKVVWLGVSIWSFNLAYIISIVAFFASLPMLNWMFLFAASLKLTAELFFLWPITRFARRTRLLTYLPLLSVVHPLYLVYIGVAGNMGKYSWKGRRVN